MEEEASRDAVRPRLSYHATHYPSACTDHAGPEEDPGDLWEALEVAEHHDQQARTAIDLDPCEIAWRALDKMFPRDDDEWSDWSAREGTSDDDDVDQVTDGDKEETDCPGKLYPESEAEAIGRKWADSYFQKIIEHNEICDEIMALGDDDDTPLPPHPMQVFPHVTAACVLGLDCHHRVYRTHDTSTTPSTLGYRTPKVMLQLFSLRLSSFETSYPSTVYGIFAVRDYVDPRRNYVFNLSRLDAVTVQEQESFVLPLCSPCRGMYVADKALLEVDLWEKKEGDESADKHLFFAYVEVDFVLEYDGLFCGRIPGNNCNLDITYTALSKSVEAAIQVYAKLDHPHHVKFTAFSTGYCKAGVVLSDEKLFGSEKLFQHIVAIKANEKLDVVLEVDNSLFKWTFQEDYVGAVVSPDDSILDYGQFLVRVLFAPKDCH